MGENEIYVAEFFRRIEGGVEVGGDFTLIVPLSSFRKMDAYRKILRSAILGKPFKIPVRIREFLNAVVKLADADKSEFARRLYNPRRALGVCGVCPRRRPKDGLDSVLLFLKFRRLTLRRFADFPSTNPVLLRVRHPPRPYRREIFSPREILAANACRRDASPRAFPSMSRRATAPNSRGFPKYAKGRNAYGRQSYILLQNIKIHHCAKWRRPMLFYTRRKAQVRAL